MCAYQPPAGVRALPKRFEKHEFEGRTQPRNTQCGYYILNSARRKRAISVKRRRYLMSAVRNVSVAAAAALLMTVASNAGPLDFGRTEFERAVSERGLSRSSPSLQTKLGEGKPECFTIAGTTIAAGDERGLMYGYLEAAEQIRSGGRLSDARGCPSVAMRGIRYFLHNHD